MSYGIIVLSLALLCLLALNIIMVRLMVHRNNRFVEGLQEIRTNTDVWAGQPK
jgi:hypothetical protein